MLRVIGEDDASADLALDLDAPPGAWWSSATPTWPRWRTSSTSGPPPVLVPEGLLASPPGALIQPWPGGARVRCHGRVQVGGPDPHRGRGPVPAGDLVGERHLQEIGMGQVPLAGQGQALGQGVEHLAQLEPAQHGGELRGHGGGRRRAHEPAPTPVATGELASASYPSGAGNRGNGSSLSGLTRDGAGRLTGLTWSLADASVITSDALTRSQSGRVTDRSLENVDATPLGRNFSYDGAGRLISASVAGHALTYVYDPANGCGPSVAAGRNTNRSSVTDNTTTVSYCYDNADRLVSSTDATVGTPTYDARGNTTTLGTTALAYDGADRHASSSTGGTSVSYVRDATGRIVARTEDSATTRYGHAGPGDSPAFTLSTSNTVLQANIGLVGGATLAMRPGAPGEVWSYPDTHGDVAASASFAPGGVVPLTPRASPRAPMTPTAVPSGPSPTTPTATSTMAGWPEPASERSCPGPAHRHRDGSPAIRPWHGPVQSVDPVMGGSANDYDYTSGDPVNRLDLDGTKSKPRELTDGEKATLGRLIADCSGPDANGADISGSASCQRFRVALKAGNLREFGIGPAFGGGCPSYFKTGVAALGLGGFGRAAKQLNNGNYVKGTASAYVSALESAAETGVLGPAALPTTIVATGFDIYCANL